MRNPCGPGRRTRSLVVRAASLRILRRARRVCASSLSRSWRSSAYNRTRRALAAARDMRSALDRDRLLRLIEAGRSVVAERELEGVFARLLDVARELTGARYAAIGVLDDAREHLADFITAGIDDDLHATIGDLPRGRGVLGLLISNPVPLRLREVGAHARSYGFPRGHPAMTNFLGVPILIMGEAWGNLYLPHT